MIEIEKNVSAGKVRMFCGFWLPLMAAAVAAIMATKTEIGSLEAQLTSANAVMASQEQGLRNLQYESDMLRLSAEILGRQIAATEQMQNLMSAAMAKGIVWMVNERGEVVKLGGEFVGQAAVVDAKTAEMLDLFFKFSTGHVDLTLADIWRIVAEWQTARDEIDRIAAGMRGGAGLAAPGAVSVPSGAKGGLVTGAGLAMLHPPEVIIPLSSPRAQIAMGGGIDYDRLAAALARQPIVVQMDGQTVARVVRDEQLVTSRRLGGMVWS